MRCVAVVIVLALLLPSALATGRSGGPAPAPLDLFDVGLRGSPSAVLVVEVYYNALRADEYVVLANVNGAPVNVTDWSITDGEGTLTFPANALLPANATIVIAQNSTAYAEDTLAPADYRYAMGNATAMTASGSFQLANAGDEVLLRDASGTVADAFIYGTSTYAGPGWIGPPARTVGAGFVARRASDPGWRDGDTAADWDLVRVRALGQSDVPPASFEITGAATASVSPDDGQAALTGLIDNVTLALDLEVYTFTSRTLAARIEAALARGVRARILLEGGPVGGVDTDEWGIARGLAASGADVRFIVNNTTRDVQERYRYVHAKYAVLDARTVFVSSENWGPSGFGPPGTRGSRGWSIAITDVSLAAYFGRVFAGDFDGRRRDIVSITDLAVKPVTPKPPPTGVRSVRIPAQTFSGPFRVTPVLAPDTSLANETILGALRRAEHAIHAELFYAYPDWGAFPDPYLDALLAAARRGVSVRLLLDSSPPNVGDGDPSNNTNTANLVNAIAAREGLDLEAKLADLVEHGFTEIHNKGLVIDSRTVLVSSINWNRNSATANREAGLLVENAQVGAYFDAAFAWDWKGDLTPPRADAGPDRAVDVGVPVSFSGLGSSDNKAVANYSWDVDADGTFDLWGPEVTYVYRQTGTYEVRLRVADAANNTANATATITVRARSVETDISLLWILPFLATSGIFVILFVRRRRKGIK